MADRYHPDRIRYREQILRTVELHPWWSAYQVATHIGAKWGTISSQLYKLVQEGVVQRKKGCGPKGGWGYALVRPPREGVSSRYDRLLGEDLV